MTLRSTPEFVNSRTIGSQTGDLLIADDQAISVSRMCNCAQHARSQYVRCINEQAQPWWTDVVITANSRHQELWYEDEIRRRSREGKVPPFVNWLVAPDSEGTRLGSGGATLNALRMLAESFPNLDWTKRRVLMIHSGGDSRRLPQYSSPGKLFSILPVMTPWGETSTLFDEFLAFSTEWVGCFDSGLLISSGDVLLIFDASRIVWNRPGVSGVAVLQSSDVGSQHGVYVVDQEGRVYMFLQKPSAPQLKDAGGICADGLVALDSGLLRFDAGIAAELTAVASRCELNAELDLYRHFTMALTGQWVPKEDAPAVVRELVSSLRKTPFWCSVVEGNFTHLGTTRAFRSVFEQKCDLTRIYKSHQLLGRSSAPNMQSAGVIVDCIFTGGGEVGPSAMAIECIADVPVHVGRGAILHGISDISSPIVVPDNMVVHQLFVRLSGQDPMVVIRVYGIEDDPKQDEWLHRPISHFLDSLGIDPDVIWPNLQESDRNLWNAKLYVSGTVEETWECASWIMGLNPSYSVKRWLSATRLSLGESSRMVDLQATGEMRLRRRTAHWRLAAQTLASSGADLQPMLANSPGMAALISTGKALCLDAYRLKELKPTDAASRFQAASLFFQQAGLVDRCEEAKVSAFQCVRIAVDRGSYASKFLAPPHQWKHYCVEVAAPARVDLGGGWSDTPPFCLDWGGTVLNVAVELNGTYPIKAVVRKVDEPVIRCISDSTTKEFTTCADLNGSSIPGSPTMISQICLQFLNICTVGETLSAALTKCGGGLEICTDVDLPIGSGLGTSSILAATVLRGLSEMVDRPLSNQQLSDLVMQVEQKMTTGGGWQDQVGGIFPGAKLAVSAPGVQQHVRVEPLSCAAGLSDRMLLYYTGIQRLAKDLLQQVVGRYLARETAVIQVLHHIKSIAFEMSYAICAGDWDYLGALMDRHWELNQILDPYTTNSLINALLLDLRPHLAGAKLAGAGGGGFLILVSRSQRDTLALRTKLADLDGQLYDWRIAKTGMRLNIA
jgi:fucokinase